MTEEKAREFKLVGFFQSYPVGLNSDSALLSGQGPTHLLGDSTQKIDVSHIASPDF